MPASEKRTTSKEGENALHIAEIKQRDLADGQTVSIDPHLSTLDGQFTVKELRKIADAMEELARLGAPSISAEVRGFSDYDEFRQFWDAGKANGAVKMIVENIDSHGVCNVPYYVMAEGEIFCGEDCAEAVTDRAAEQIISDQEFNFEEDFDLQFARTRRPLHVDGIFGNDILD